MSRRHSWIVLLAVLSISYAALTGSLLSSTTVQYDEFTDLLIASDLERRPLQGSTRDPSQARLPMYVTAVAYKVMRVVSPGTSLLDVLPVSRAISIFMTVVAIWGTAILGRRLFDPATGLFAAALFTFSPYVLHFGRDAMTQGDAFTPAAVVLVLIAFERFHAERRTLWLVALSCSLGAAIACKFTLVFLPFALLVYQGLCDRVWRREHLGRASAAKRVPDWTAPSFLLLSVGTGTSAALAFVFSRAAADGAPAQQALHAAAQATWLIALAGVLSSVLWGVMRFRREQVPAHSGWHWMRGWLVILPLTAATVLTICPEHVFNPEILSNLAERFSTRDGGQAVLPTMVASLRLYTGLLLLKLGLPLGVCTCIALAWALVRARTNPRLGLLILTLALYAGVLAMLPLQQPFWLMSVYPLILLVLAAMLVAGWRRVADRRVRAAVMLSTAAGVSWLAVGLVRAYPTFGYYGYETVGTRWLGADTRGYRSLVVVTNDGSTEALDWLRRTARPGAIVLSFLDDVHLLRYLVRTQRFPFELEHALTLGDPTVLADAVTRAEFVIERTAGDAHRPYLLAPAAFAERFEGGVVHEIVRGRGIYKMPVIRIYKVTVRAATDQS